jgi:hypothetical protein
MHDVGLHLMGRNTFEEMAEFWPVSDDAYAAPMNEIPKVVFSRTLERAEWADSRIARGDLADEIATLKCEPGKEILAWAAPRSPNRSADSGSSTSTASSCSLLRWARGFPCSRAHRAAAARARRRADIRHGRSASRLPPRARGLLNHAQDMTVGGEVLVAGSAEYESARRSQIARFDDVRPHAVVRCRVPEDVAQALAFARDEGLHIALRSGGHCSAGRSSTTGVVIDVSGIDGCRSLTARLPSAPGRALPTSTTRSLPTIARSPRAAGQRSGSRA